MLDYRMDTFLVLCDEMNYRKTAEKLNISQPAVTQHIQYLEKYYGCRFFTYKGKKLYKTSQATYLEQYARSEKYNAYQLEEHFRLAKQEKFRIGTTKTVGDYMLHNKIPELTDNQVYELSVIVDNTKALLDLLNHQELDLLLVEGVFDKDQYGYQLYRQEAFVGVCHRDHPFAGKDISLSDLMNEHIIIREEGSGTKYIFEQILLSKSYKLTQFSRKTCLSSFKLIESMIVSGRGITFAYESFANSHPEMTSFRLKDMDYIREINFVYLKNTNVSKWIELFS